MIKIITGHSGPGGSTVALNSLTNLFNENGINAKLYSQIKWDGIDCNYDTLDKLNLIKDDILIYHFMVIPKTIAKKTILSCHETNLFEIKKIPNLFYDNIHFVSKFQKDWHGVSSGVVIPNVIRKFEKVINKKFNKVAGIIGSVDSHKRTHLSILRALNDGYDDVRIYGPITDFPYFKEFVEPLLSDKVKIHGVSKNMSNTYSELSEVYSSSKRECLPTIQGECLRLGIKFNALDESKRDELDFEFDNSVILNKWKNLLELT